MVVVTLPPAMVTACVALMHEVEKAFRESCIATGSEWPGGWCVEACVALHDELMEKIPQAGAEYVWGQVGEPEVRMVGHAWIELADGTWLDPTLEQFADYIRLRWPTVVIVGPSVVMPDDPIREAFHVVSKGRPDL